MITNQIDYQGDLKIGHNVKIGYFAQNQTELLNKNLTANETLEEVADSENRPKSKYSGTLYLRRRYNKKFQCFLEAKKPD